jgi:DNA polymerase IV
MTDSGLKRKQEFYRSLSDALAERDDELDSGLEGSRQTLQKAKEAAAANNTASTHGLARSVSDTNLVASSKESRRSAADSVQRKQPSSAREGRYPGLLKGATFCGPPSKAMTKLPTSKAQASGIPSSSAVPKIIGKRKRSINMMPEDKQIFRGMHFYFFPNNDSHPARAMRIAKALEFGATWQRDFNDSVTHIIVDKHLTYDQLLKQLKLDTLPEKVNLVSENYPAECISFHAVLEPNQARFGVKGYVQPDARKASTEIAVPASGSNRSLELKPAGRSVRAREPETLTPELRAHDVASEQPVQDAARDVATEQAATTAEFDAAVKQARELQHFSLDNEDEAELRPTSSGGHDTDDEDAPTTATPKRKPMYKSVQDRFQCMQKHTGSKPDNPNAATIEILQQMADYYGQIGDEWRIRAYRKAIGALRNHPVKVWTKEEALSLPQIGERLATKIEEIAFTNRLRRLESAQAEPTDQVLQTFMKVYGAGFAKASEWVSMGYKTLDELLANAGLTENQRIGIEHYEDFNSRIPRAEVEKHGDIVRRTLQKIDPSFELIIGGSYRRGAKDSGDIDCIITRPRPETSAAHLRTVVLDQLVPKLTKSGFLVASLATTSRDDGSKWHGASCLPGSTVWRRIDLLLVPSDEIGAALIYFTGNDIFNRSLRLLASTKGMRLNQRGLYKDVFRGKDRVKVTEGTLVEGRDERRIFEVLGVPWRPPEHRIC